jgi:hypothetical protein
MKAQDLKQAATPERLAQYLADQPKGVHHHGGPVESVREADHKGHHIVVRTTYQFEVDARPLDLPMGVDNDGHVHCHSLPNYQFQSAITMVKQLIDTFPTDFPKSKSPQPAPPMEMPISHDGMTMPRSQRKGKKR